MDVPTIAVAALALIACAFDVWTRRIPNVLTIGGAVMASAFYLSRGGPAACAWSASGWLVVVALFLPFFALRGLGAGDVKLLGAIGAWLGPASVLYVAFFTALAGGAMALLLVLARGYLREAFQNVWLLLTHWRVVGVRPHPTLTLEDGRGPRLAYAIPIAVGAATTLWLR